MAPARPKQAAPIAKGADELILSGVQPRHLHAQPEYIVEGVSADVYRVCERLQELDPRMFVQAVVHKPSGTKWFAIMRRGGLGEYIEGLEELVFKTTCLDPRVVEQVRHILHVPIAHRAKAAVERSEKWEAEQAEAEKDDLVERLGLPMLRDLREMGFLGEYGKGGNSSYQRPKFGKGGHTGRRQAPPAPGTIGSQTKSGLVIAR